MKHKSQSAMEYLMTYGWAILIILIVAGALFFLFNYDQYFGEEPINETAYNIDDRFRELLEDFCKDKTGSKPATVNFSPSYTYGYVSCMIYRDEWTKSQSFEKQEFKQWLYDNKIELCLITRE